jgi:hypothetical protein
LAKISIRPLHAAGLAALGLLAVLPAQSFAATVTLNGSGDLADPSYSVVSTGPGTYSVAVGNDYLLAVPGQYTFAGQFLTNQSALPTLGPSSVGAYTFQDSYQFTISDAANGNALTASLSLGNYYQISNLQLRLYQLTGAPTLPIVGSLQSYVTAGQVNVVSPWQGGGPLILATFDNVAAGTYILDIAGIASGDLGGSYVGQLNLAPTSPVPLPAGVWLLVSGLGALGGMASRRRKPA